MSHLCIHTRKKRRQVGRDLTRLKFRATCRIIRLLSVMSLVMIGSGLWSISGQAKSLFLTDAELVRREKPPVVSTTKRVVAIQTTPAQIWIGKDRIMLKKCTLSQDEPGRIEIHGPGISCLLRVGDVLQDKEISAIKSCQ